MNYSVLRNDESGKYKYIHSITDRVLLNAITLLYKSSLQNDSALFVPKYIILSFFHIKVAMDRHIKTSA